MDFIYNCIKFAQNAFAARHCLLCRARVDDGLDLCPACRADLPWLAHQCRHCALALDAARARPLCGDCARRPRFDAAHAAFAYEEPVRWLITQLKFHARLGHARVLGELLAADLLRYGIERPQLLVPVPLHPAGLRRRGFNQAERIARIAARRLDVPLAQPLARTRDTARQSELSAAKRAANVRGAFRATRALGAGHVALVDDVVTTAHTAQAAARALRQAGASRVDLYCVARA